MIANAVEEALSKMLGSVASIPFVHTALGYGWWIMWAVVAVVALSITAKIKDVAGWPGVFAEFVAVAYLAGFIRAKHGMSINPVDFKVPELKAIAARPIVRRK